MVLTSNYKQHERKKAIITSKTATFSMLKKHFTPATNCLAREGAAFATEAIAYTSYCHKLPSCNGCDLEERHGNMSRDEGWALFKRRIFRGKEYRRYYQTNCIKATVAFRFDSKILANPPYPATERTLLLNKSDPSPVAGKPICYSRGSEKKCILLPL